MTDDEARKIIEVCKNLSDGYGNPILDIGHRDEKQAQACSIAVSNTGFFILQAFGYSADKIHALAREVPGTAVSSAGGGPITVV